MSSSSSKKGDKSATYAAQFARRISRFEFGRFGEVTNENVPDGRLNQSTRVFFDAHVAVGTKQVVVETQFSGIS